ncbi:ABC transporter permease [uncultured Mediterranea sp.]|uniref:ABC transporter permease n=1 Tax=uncultured Mediterranea sp. TaxID=1926662 RepID=UPI002587350F|nr:ABC transporter permease [uncultured Mediterranea sp.]
MLRHYIKVALRLIRRSLLFSSINLMGFVLGLTAAFLIYLWVVDELTHDDCFRDGSRIYRVTELRREAGGEVKESPRLPRTLAMDFRQKFPQVEDATAIKYGDQYSYEAEGGKKMTVTEVYVDSTFFRFFTFPVVEGTPQRINENPNNVVISAELARKFFGSGSAVGQKLTYSFGNSISDVYTVVAVVDIPRKSHIRFELAMPMEAYGRGGVNINWNIFTESMHVYIKMKEGSAMLRSEAQSMSRLLADRGEKNVRLGFQPLHDIYLHTRFADPDVKQHGNLSTVYLFIALAVLVIFMGAFNFTTLSTARASLRYKEVGVRKVTGAKRRVLIGQFLSEGMVQACIALVLAMALTELTLPLFNRVMETDLRLEASWSVVFYMLFGIVGVGCLAGSYPAFYLSSVNPLLAFKGGRKTGRKGGLIRGLVCVQFVIALVLMLLTGIVFKQLHYMQNKDMGLDKENIVCIYTSLWYNVGDFKQELLRNPDIKGVSMSSPIENFGEGTSYKDGNKVEWTDVDGRTDSLRMVQLWADGDFVKTFGMLLVKGKLMDDDFDNYWDHGMTKTAVINETAWRAMKVPDPIGLEIRPEWGGPMRIVGVVKDFNFQSMREQIKPAYIWYNPEVLSYLYIKIAPERRQQTLAFIKEKFEEFATRDNTFIKDFSYQFFSDKLNQNYVREQQQSRMLLFFTVLAILIAVMGVFGLVALSTEQRTKEIGIRKVNGAHSDRIVRMFCREYLVWVGIAFVVACPVGYWLMSSWLSEFAYQTPISWWLFLLVGLLTVLITLLTVVGQTWRKASQNPVESLRYE